MEKKGLIIGIDYQGEYCQASYYSRRHRRTESIAYGGDTVRYLIPTALTYDHEAKDWIIGQPAIEYAEKTGETLYRSFLENVLLGDVCAVNGQKYTYTQLLAIFIGKIIELTQTATAIMAIEMITINLRRVSNEVRDTMKRVIRLLKLPPDKVKLKTCAESFAYYVLAEEPEIREHGVLLLDFSADGFYEKVLTQKGLPGRELSLVSERTHNQDFTIDDMGNEVLMEQMEEKLIALYEEICSSTRISSVYFTGEGFPTMWFSNALQMISETSRAFKGNNLYAKGACLASLVRSEEVPEPAVLCAGKTKCTIAIEARHLGEPILLNLSKAPADWYDAETKMDLILDGDDNMRFFVITLSGTRNSFDVDISAIPKRPKKATRIELTLQFFNEDEGEVVIRDKGFGELFEASDVVIKHRFKLSDFPA